MTTTKIPTWLRLDTGSHDNSCDMCVEECLSILLNQDKTDHPDGVHVIIRDIATKANDSEPDPEKRRLLARTLACQVGTDRDDVTDHLSDDEIFHGHHHGETVNPEGEQK